MDMPIYGSNNIQPLPEVDTSSSNSHTSAEVIDRVLCHASTSAREAETRPISSSAASRSSTPLPRDGRQRSGEDKVIEIYLNDDDVLPELREMIYRYDASRSARPIQQSRRRRNVIASERMM